MKRLTAALGCVLGMGTGCNLFQDYDLPEFERLFEPATPQVYRFRDGPQSLPIKVNTQASSWHLVCEGDSLACPGTWYQGSQALMVQIKPKAAGNADPVATLLRVETREGKELGVTTAYVTYFERSGAVVPYISDVRVDGSCKDYEDHPGVTLSKTNRSSSLNLEPEDYDIHVAWNDQGFYFCGDIRDTLLWRITDRVEGRDPFNDGLSIFLQPLRENLQFDDVSKWDGVLDDPCPTESSALDACVVKVRAGALNDSSPDDGYVMEGRFPWSSKRPKPSAGEVWGAQILLRNRGDSPGAKDDAESWLEIIRDAGESDTLLREPKNYGVFVFEPNL